MEMAEANGENASLIRLACSARSLPKVMRMFEYPVLGTGMPVEEGEDG
jgi:hypothetical protein